MKPTNGKSGGSLPAAIGFTPRWSWRCPTRRIGVLAICLTLAGCAGWFPTTQGYRQGLNAWIGFKGEELMQRWGLPTHEHAAPNGGKAYQYEKERSYTVSGGTKSERIQVNGNDIWVDIPQPDEIRTTWCQTTFYLNADDTITHYSFQGPDCRAYEKKAD